MDEAEPPLDIVVEVAVIWPGPELVTEADALPPGVALTAKKPLTFPTPVIRAKLGDGEGGVLTLWPPATHSISSAVRSRASTAWLDSFALFVSTDVPPLFANARPRKPRDCRRVTGASSFVCKLEHTQVALFCLSAPTFNID
jgi:hypothetical protein